MVKDDENFPGIYFISRGISDTSDRLAKRVAKHTAIKISFENFEPNFNPLQTLVNWDGNSE
jgi:hypothetical protein